VPEVLPLENPQDLLPRYYRGLQIESPAGGVLMLLGVRADPEGGARAIFECSASSLRYQLTIPPAARAERAAVREEIEAGREPGCPRHGPGRRLARAGSSWMCPECGIAFT